MGTVYSIQKTKWDQDVPPSPIKPIEHGGRIRSSYAEYEAAAEQSDIQMFNLPNGARILRGTVTYDALGTSTTISVGHGAYNNADGTAVTADVDEYKAAAASTSAAAVACAATVALGLHSVVDADKDGIPITVSLAGANGTGTIALSMDWVLD
jgi:hypothetical protein